MSGSSKSPSRCSEDKIAPSLVKDDISTPFAEHQSIGSTSPVASVVGEQSSSISLTNFSAGDTSSSRGRDADLSDDTSDQTGRIRCALSPTITSIGPQNTGTSSNVESAVILNSGNQSSGSDTADLTKGIPLKSICSGPISSSRSVPLVGPYINRDPCSSYKRFADVSSSEEIPPPTTVAAEIYDSPKSEKKICPRQSETISPSNVATSSGIEIPGSSQQKPSQSENPPESQWDRIHPSQSPVNSPTPDASKSEPPSLSQKVQKVYVKLEPLFLILICGLFFSIILPLWLQSDRMREISLPSYPYNLTRPVCIDRKFYRTLNCLQKNETKYLTKNFIRKDCLDHLKPIFREEFCSKNNLSSPNLFYGTYNGSIDGTYFFRNLTGSNDTLNADNVLKYMTCVRVFEKNPFGEVKVVARANEAEQSIIRYNFVLKNYKLMTECKIIPSDSLFDYFKDQKRVYGFVTWGSSSATVLSLICTFVRFHLEEKEKVSKTAKPKTGSPLEISETLSPPETSPPPETLPSTETLPPPGYEDTAL